MRSICWVSRSYGCMLQRHCFLLPVAWLMNHQLQKLVIAVSGVDSGETLERWAFELECDKEVTEAG